MHVYARVGKWQNKRGRFCCNQATTQKFPSPCVGTVDIQPSTEKRRWSEELSPWGGSSCTWQSKSPTSSRQQLSVLLTCLLSHQESVSWNRLSGTRIVLTQVLLASVKVGVSQGTKMCTHSSGNEVRWQEMSLSLPSLVTARFPRGQELWLHPSHHWD